MLVFYNKSGNTPDPHRYILESETEADIECVSVWVMVRERWIKGRWLTNDRTEASIALNSFSFSR
jgi:hypothetical protein